MTVICYCRWNVSRRRTIDNGLTRRLFCRRLREGRLLVVGEFELSSLSSLRFFLARALSLSLSLSVRLFVVVPVNRKPFEAPFSFFENFAVDLFLDDAMTAGSTVLFLKRPRCHLEIDSTAGTKIHVPLTIQSLPHQRSRIGYEAEVSSVGIPLPIRDERFDAVLFL